MLAIKSNKGTRCEIAGYKRQTGIRMKIVPANRLLFWVGVVFLPFSILAAVVPAATLPAIGLGVAMIILAVIDAAGASGCFAGVRVALPEMIRLSAGRPGSIGVHIENDGLKLRHLRLGLALPSQIETPAFEMSARLPLENSLSLLNWPISAHKQGRYILEKCFLETTSRLGFWSLRTQTPVHSEIRVYPNLFVERKQLTSLFQNRGLGIHARRQIGKGRDFEQLREYLPGDSYEDIYWKATARRGTPITKSYQIERTQRIYVLIDASRLSARSIGDRPVPAAQSGDPARGGYTSMLDRFTTAALILALAAERQGDLFGLLTFSDRLNSFVRAKSGKFHYGVCRDALYTLQPRSVSPDFAELFTFIGTRIRRRSLLIFLTHLDDPVLADSFVQYIGLLSRRHLVLVNMLKPPEAGPLFSSETMSSVDGIYRELGGHLIWRRLQETGRVLQRYGVGFHLLENENLCPELVTQYLALKQRQLL